MTYVITWYSKLLSAVTVTMAVVRTLIILTDCKLNKEDSLKFFPSPRPFPPFPCFSLLFDAFDDILPFASYKWFLIRLASTSTEFPEWSHREKPKSPQSLATTFSQRRIAFLWHQLNQMQLQGVGVRKSKFFTSTEFYVYHVLIHRTQVVKMKWKLRVRFSPTKENRVNQTKISMKTN